MPSRKSRNCRKARNRKTRKMVGGFEWEQPIKDAMEKFEKDLSSMNEYAEKMSTLEELSTIYDALREGVNDTLAASKAVSEHFSNNLKNIHIPKDKQNDLYEAAKKVRGIAYTFKRLVEAFVYKVNGLENNADYLNNGIFGERKGLIKLLKETYPEIYNPRQPTGNLN